MSLTSSQELTIICKNVSKCSKGFANSSQEITIIGESENKVTLPRLIEVGVHTSRGKRFPKMSRGLW